MRKLLSTLVFSLCLMASVIGQGLVDISIYVVDQNGNALPNTYVSIIYNDCNNLDTMGVNTDPNGIADFNFGVCTQGTFWGDVYCSAISSTPFSGSWDPGNTSQIITAVCNNGSSNNCVSSFAAYDSLSWIYFFPNVTGGTAPFTYSWDFGDGNISNVAYPIHQYATSGPYYACLSVTDALGNLCTYCDTVGTGLNCNTNIVVYGDSLFTSNVTGMTAPLSYFWDFGDNNFANVSDPIHYYQNPGTYTACLTIYDANNITCTECVSVTITGTGNPCTGYADAQISSGGGYSFTAVDNNAVNVDWDFGDGNFGSGINVFHMYNAPGTYTACANVITMQNDTCQYCTVVTVQGAPCTGDFTYTYVVTPIGGQYNFVANPSGNAPFTYLWDLGDGQTSTQANPSNIYTIPGSYTICLTTVDAFGDQCTYCDSIWVNQSNPINSISGTLTTNNIPANDGVVYLIEYDSTGSGGTLTLVDSMLTQQGYYSFYDIADGDYLVKGALLPSSPDYWNFVPTYYVNSLVWSSGQSVATFNGSAYTANVNLIAGVNPGGPGFIGGLVSQGANFAGPGDPIAGVQVVLMDLDGNPVAYTFSDAAGEFEFNGIAYGTYKIHAEVLGKPTTAGEVTINATTPTVETVAVEVNSDYVITYVNSVDTDNPSLVSSIKVLGNPIQDQIVLQADLAMAGQWDVRVLNLLGQTVAEASSKLSSGINHFVVPMQNASNGMYIIELYVDGKSAASLKVVK